MLAILFWAFAGIAVVSALLCVTRRSPMASALWLVLTMCALSAVFLLLDAQFLAIIQVLVYAGAIMVLVLFVIMLLNLGRGGPGDLRVWLGRVVAWARAAGVAVQLWALPSAVRTRGGFAAETAAYPLPPGGRARMQEARGAVGMVAEPLLRQYLVPFEITSVLLLAAIVGAVVLAKRKI